MLVTLDVTHSLIKCYTPCAAIALTSMVLFIATRDCCEQAPGSRASVDAKEGGILPFKSQDTKPLLRYSENEKIK